MTNSFFVRVAVLTLFGLASQAQAEHFDLLGKPYPRIELFPENIMKPYDALDFPWIEQPAEALPSNFQYILKPFFLQAINWLC